MGSLQDLIDADNDEVLYDGASEAAGDDTSQVAASPREKAVID